MHRALGSESGELDRRAIKFYDRVVFPIRRLADLPLFAVAR